VFMMRGHYGQFGNPGQACGPQGLAVDEVIERLGNTAVGFRRRDAEGAPRRSRSLSLVRAGRNTVC